MKRVPSVRRWKDIRVLPRLTQQDDPTPLPPAPMRPIVEQLVATTAHGCGLPRNALTTNEA